MTNDDIPFIVIPPDLAALLRGEPMHYHVYTEGKRIYLRTGQVLMRIDQAEFLPAVISYLNGGDHNGQRYILETTIVESEE